MGLKGLRRNEEPADIESEREALRRQRVEAAEQLETLKRTLAERVAQVQQRERELAEALAKAEKREQNLVAAEERSSRLTALRLRLTEAKEARVPRDDDANVPVLPAVAFPAEALELRESELNEREEALTRRTRELEEREASVEARAATPVPDEPEPARPEPSEHLEARLAELRAAEQAFSRTQAELTARSDALALREEALAAAEQALSAKEVSSGVDLEALESRIRRLEGSRTREREPQTFSAGLRALQERGLRATRSPDEPLH